MSHTKGPWAYSNCSSASSGCQGNCDGNPWTRLMKPGDLENIPPEPVKQSFYLWFNEADKGASLYAHSNYSPHFKPSMAKILIWAEDGKTKVEVCDD